MKNMVITQHTQNIKLNNFLNTFEMNLKDMEGNIYILHIKLIFISGKIDIQLKYDTDIIDAFNENDRMVKDISRYLRNTYSVISTTFVNIDNDSYLDLIILSSCILKGIRHVINHARDANNIIFSKSIDLPLSILTKTIAKYYLIKLSDSKKDENKND